MGIWDIANIFREQVCQALCALTSSQRDALRGDYLFIIDDSPRFVVTIQSSHAFSSEVPSPAPHQQDPEQISSLKSTARARISTSSTCLERLLQGTLKARLAFLTGRVRISGDLPAFLKMISLLKKQGIAPLGTTQDEAQI